MFISPNDQLEASDNENALIKIGFKVGLLIDFTDKGLDLAFYINREFIGSPFVNMQIKEVTPVVFLKFYQSSVRLIERPAYPPIN